MKKTIALLLVLCILLSLACLAFLYVSKELLRQRSLWMSTAAAAILVCLLFCFTGYFNGWCPLDVFRELESVSASDCAAFAAGMELGDGLHCLPARLEPGDAADEAFVTLHEGKFHQIKRMFAARGKPVLYLKRISMGGISLDSGLKEGEYRYLSDQEVAILSGFGGETTPIHK